MVSTNSQPKEGPECFEGSVAGLGLREVIQLNGQTRFSGCVTVQYNGNVGLIFFRDGEIVHSEYNDKTGEKAFFDILEWPAGRFSLQSNVSTTSHTVQKSWKDLLAEVPRVGNERRQEMKSNPQESSSKPVSANSIIERLLRIPGVVHAVLQTKDGARVGDDSFETEALAGQAAYLALIGNRLGNVFHAGEIHFAAVQGASRHLLVFSSKSHYLSVLVQGDTLIGAVDAEIRKILASK